MKYNVEKMVERGRQVMAANPKREISTTEFITLSDRNPGKWEMANEAYLLGVAIGERIGKAEQEAKQCANNG